MIARGSSVILLGLCLGLACDERNPGDDDTAMSDDDTAMSDDDTAMPDDDTADDDDAADDDTASSTDHDLFLEFLDALDGTTSASEKRDLAESLVETIHYSDGWPIHHGGSLTFCALLDEAPSGGISVAGDFDGWDPDTNFLQQEVDVLYFWITVEVGDPIPRHKYKFVIHGGGDPSWEPDPWARRYGYDEFGEHSLTAGAEGDSHLERYRDFSCDNLTPRRDLRLYIPAAPPADAAYPALYMHDGQNLFDPTAPFGEWQVDGTFDELIVDGTIRPALVVGIDNTGDRIDEYTHVMDDIGHGPMGGLGDDYAACVVEQIIPFVESRYDIEAVPAARGLLGSSLGGLISFHIAYLHPDTFGAVGGMSSTLGWGAYGFDEPTMMDQWASTQHSDTRLYIDSGGSVTGQCDDPDGDGWHEDAMDSDNYCVTLQMAATLESLGYQYEVDLFHWWEPDASHNESAWAARLPLFLQTVFPR